MGHGARGAVRARRPSGRTLGSRLRPRCSDAARAAQHALPARHDVPRTCSRSRRISARPSRTADDVLVAVPSHALRETLTALAALPLRRLAWATKGFELDTGLLPYQVAGQLLPASLPTAVLSGPTFAREVGAGLPTAMTIASADDGLRAAARRAHQQRNVSRLHLERRRRRRGRRRYEERLRDRRRHLRRPRVRREHAHRADRARPRRDDAPGARARRTQGDLHGPRRHGRPRAHLHRRSIAQPPFRARARRRRHSRERRCARSARSSRATTARAPCIASPSSTRCRCRSSSSSTRCCMKARIRAPRSRR